MSSIDNDYKPEMFSGKYEDDENLSMDKHLSKVETSEKLGILMFTRFSLTIHPILLVAHFL